MKDERTASYICTGVYATPEEIALIRFEFGKPIAKIGGVWPEPEKLMHQTALAHGLPEIVGFYGCDFRDGEFIRVKDEDMAPGEPSSRWGGGQAP